VLPAECDQQYTSKPKTAEEIQHRCLQKPSRQRRQAPVPSLPANGRHGYVIVLRNETSCKDGKMLRGFLV
jgi:hypothetical protein